MGVVVARGSDRCRLGGAKLLRRGVFGGREAECRGGGHPRVWDGVGYEGMKVRARLGALVGSYGRGGGWEEGGGPGGSMYLLTSGATLGACAGRGERVRCEV